MPKQTTPKSGPKNPPRASGRLAKPPSQIIGRIESIHLPELLGEQEILAKVDTGADLSSLDARDVELFSRGGKRWVRFKLVTWRGGTKSRSVSVEARAAGPRKAVHSASGRGKRHVIRTEIVLAGVSWQADFTLTSRRAQKGRPLKFRALIGWKAIARRFLVDPGHPAAARE